MQHLTSALIEFGLSEKEANVYLAMLELGPSSAQDIAKKAGVNRATTYVMLESLNRRGLMSSTERGKKTLYAAESPEHIVHIMGGVVRTVQDKMSRLQSVMPDFLALFNAIEDKPKVRFFEGEEGVRTCREAIAAFAGKQEGRAIIHFDAATVQTAHVDEEQRLRLTNRLPSVRLVYSVDSGLQLPTFSKMTQARRMPTEALPFKGELYIFETFVLVSTTKTKPMGVIIESADVATLFKSMFEIIWQQAKQ